MIVSFSMLGGFFNVSMETKLRKGTYSKFSLVHPKFFTAGSPEFRGSLPHHASVQMTLEVN